MLNLFTFMLVIFGSTNGTKKPNIIFILTDDQGSADVGFANPNSQFKTENIDKIAANSIRLSNYYVHPTCTPTRAALMTGRYAANVGLSLALIPGNPGGLDPKYQTLPEHLGEMGYRNYLVGKWHLGQSKKMYHPLSRGFHEFYGLLGAGFNHFTKQQGAGRFDFWRGFEPLFDNKTHSTDLINGEALQIVQKHADDPQSDPFFMYIAYPAPHDPLGAPERHQELCSHIKNHRRMMSCAMVAGIDEGVGEIVQQLADKNMLDDTIIIFSIDNGGVPYAGAFNYPLRGAKGTLYEGGCRSPGFIHAPNIFKNSYDYKDLFHIADFYPTLMAMVSHSMENQTWIALSDELDGVDQLSALKDKTAGPRKNVHIHRDWDRDGHAYRRGPWKIIVGHHCLPFFFTKVYNETNSRWLVENGGLRDKALQLILEGIDALLGTENTIFVQYMIWMAFDSFNVGGFHRARAATGSATKEIFQEKYNTDLEYFLKEQEADPAYPMVSLFNLEEDPQETTNLASTHPNLVKELLAEAEDAIKNAPTPIRGDMVHAHASVSKQQNWVSTLRSLGSVFEEVIPFGIYLEDTQDLTKLEYVRLVDLARTDAFIIAVKLLLAFIVLPFMLILCILKYNAVF